MWRFWIQFTRPGAECPEIRTVDLSDGDLAAGFCPIAAMYLELAVSGCLIVEPAERNARVLRKRRIEPELAGRN